jgi:hypothetical protein
MVDRPATPPGALHTLRDRGLDLRELGLLGPAARLTLGAPKGHLNGMLNPYAKERCQVAREVLARYRRACRLLLWSPVLAFGATVVLTFAGFSPPTAVYAGAFCIVTIAGYFGYRHWGLDGLKNFPCINIACSSEEDQEIAYTDLFYPWVCGFCFTGHPSFNGLDRLLFWRRTIVDPCRNEGCKHLQHSVICWRCRNPIIWDEEAYRKAPKPAFPPGRPPRSERIPEKPKPVRRRPRPIDEDLR